MIPDNIKKLFMSKYSSMGRDKFYRFLISHSLEKIVDGNKSRPDLDLMEYYDKFLKLYRREGDVIYLDLAKEFRRAAHKIHRVMFKSDLIEKSAKFLTLVENGSNKPNDN